ncbi:hypothetical protein C1645_737590 [Glomus cerebriforme]|uniref:Uncharacterized protein n=1 Tax=Glomus cerebriforme TaxID=658196 RepID=A0A397SX85_9GLOM|nr:hypothetical protein C1645_737590 [Glomus cerebriforme]
MGSTKSLKYKVLVYQTTSSSLEQQHQPSTSSFLPDDDSSSNHSATTALFETKVQRFACDRENMQQYWIPEGYHPVLIPRAYFTDVANNNSRQLMSPVVTGDVIHQLRSRINNNDNINDIELRRRRINTFSSSCTNNNNNGGISKKRRRNNINDVNRRNILRHSSNPTVNINAAIYRQKLKERISALRNSAVSISSNSSLKNNNSNNIISDKKNSPSIIIGEMWKEEPENIKKHYERLAIRKKIAQALAFEQKFASLNSCGKSSTTPRRHHVNPTNHTGSSCRYNIHTNAVEGVDAVDFENSVHQNVVNNSAITSSPSSSSPNIFNDNNRPMPDWMSRSDDEDDENCSDIGLDI